VSDVLEEVAIDPIITETVELQGEQSGETLNEIVKNILLNVLTIFSNKF
jgi:hypothetical protein